MLIMAEVGFVRHPALQTHSELTPGYDVTYLLSQLSRNYQQSKADQILRLLKDQDKVTNYNPSDKELVEEYNEIREETVTCDGDTLTDSSSEESEVDVKERDSQPERQGEMNSRDMNEQAGMRGYSGSRSRTSLGFRVSNVNAYNRGSNFDTRDLSLRPKSSYVRRNQNKQVAEIETLSANNESDAFNVPPTQRFVKSARPKSRLGRASVQRSEKNTAVIETEVTVHENVPLTKETLNNNAVNAYIRHASARQARLERESKRAKQFWDSNAAVISEQTAADMSLDSSSNSMDTTDENHVNSVHSLRANAKLVNNLRSPQASSFDNNIASRNSPIQTEPQQPSVLQIPKSLHDNPIKLEITINNEYANIENVQQLVRTGTAKSNRTLQSERSDSAHLQMSKNNYNVVRPQNIESASSRYIDRPCPSSRHRRLQRRCVQQSQHLNTAGVRSMSASVLVARQKTDKNLCKKKNENRPYSETTKVNSNKSILSVTESPAQGPQTVVTSSGRVTQAGHIHTGGFRGYDPASRLKLSVQSRDISKDRTLPQSMHQNNILISGRKAFTLMK